MRRIAKPTAAAAGLLAAIASGCGGGITPPRGPDHTPADSPEAASVCPVEWKAAKTAREELLGNNSAAAKAKTAEAVLAQADCERIVLAGGAFTPGTHAELLEQVKTLRSGHRDTQNLYNEVASYSVPLLKIAATVGRGQLSSAFALRLKAIPTPTDMTEVGEQSAFRQEVAQTVETFENEAERELRDAVAAAGVAGGEAYRKRACTELAAMERDLPSGCGGGA